MPTLNNDLPVVTANPIEDQAAQRSRRIIGASLGATLLTVLVLFAAMALAPVDASAANTCTLTSSAPTTNWSDTTKWSGCGGGYPGQVAAGDTAVVTLGGGYTLNVDAILNPLSLQLSGSGSSVPVAVSSGGTLTLQSSSTATSNNSFTVASGGTLGVDLATNLSGWQSPTTINGGTFNVAGSISFINGAQLTFKGGTIQGGGTITIPSSQGATFNGVTSAMTLTGGTTVDNFGSVTLSSTANALSINSGAKIKNEASGTLGLSADASINTDNLSSPLIDNLGSLAKTGGSDSIINVPVNNSGSISASVGQIELNGGGTHSGSFVTSSTAPIVFSGNHNFNSGTSFSGAFPIKIGGGTQTFNASINASSGLKWAGGTIAGTGPLNVSSGLLFDGSLSPMTLTGVLKSTAAITYAPSSVSNVLTINGASAMFETASPGSLAIAGDYDIKAVPAGAGKLRISGGANVTKTAGTTGSSILAFVDNVTSTLANSSSAPLNLGGGGSSTGSVNATGASSIINFTSGTFDSSGAFSGSGIVNVAGATVNINTATSFGSGTPNFNLNGGTLGGTGTVTILSAMNWTSGTITGSSPFNVSSTGVAAITGSLGLMTLDGRVFNDNSSVVYNSPTNNLTLKNSASIVNSGTFTAIGGGTIDTDGSAVSITNNGTFNKSSAGLFLIKTTFNNAGSGVAITGGVLDIDGTGTSSAPWTMNAGTEVWFPTPFAGTYTFASGTSFAGGKVTLDGSGTVATSFPMTINNTNLEVNGGTFSTPSTFTVTAPGTLKWKGGTLSGAGHTVISSGTTFDMTTENTSRNVSAHTIDNAGNATMVSLTQQISLDSGSTFNNTGNLDIQNDGALLTNASGSNTFNNSGIVKKTVGGSGFRFDMPYNQTAGTTDANSATSGSTIIFNAGGSMSGGLLQATSSTNFVDFFNGGFTVTGGSFAGPGTIRLNGGILNVNTPTTFPPVFTMTSGSLGGTQSITIPNAAAFNWSGGSITGGAASPITVSSGGAINANATTSTLIYDTRPLQINSGGNFNWTAGTNGITFQSGSSVTDAGTFTVNANATLSNNSAGTFAVTGQFTFTGAGTLNVTLPLSVQTGGTVTSSGGGNMVLFDPASVTHTGTFDAQSGSFISFGAGTHQFNAGAGFSAGTGTYQIVGATLNLGTNVSAPNVKLLSGAISGTGNLTTTSSLNWQGGSMTGTGTTQINGTGSLSLGPLTLDTRPLVNNGTLTYSSTSGGGLILANGAVITNGAGATFNVDATQGIGVSGIGTAISNAGLMQRNTAGTVGIAPPVTNTGTIGAYGGVLAFNGGLTQSAGTTSLVGGSISSPSTIALAGGSLAGYGTVSAAVNNSGGIVAPGAPGNTGTLAITGAYSQGAGGSTNLKIGGLLNFDVLDVSTAALTLAGTLNVSLFNAFTPSSGNTFDVLKFASRSGDFATYNLPTFAGGGSFTSGYVSGTPNLLRLTAVVTASDLQIIQNAPATVLHNQSGTWVLTVTNGPTPVTNIVITDNFTNASFLSVTGPCTPSGSTVTCNFASLSANQSVNISLILFANTLSTISNSASVSATEFDPNTANNNVGPAFTTVVPAADLSLTNTASGNPVNAGAPLSFTINVTNAGPDATSGTVTVSNSFPAGVTAFTFSGAGWSCGSLSAGVATCTNAASIANSGAAPPLILSMTAPGSGPAVDSASVSAATADPNNSNNTASQSVTVVAQSDLNITKNGPTAVNAGQNIVYTIVVTNNGPSTASGVSVADPTPAGLTFISNTGACTTAFPCALGTLTNGQTATITSTYATSSGSAGTTVTNTATVSAVTADPVPSGNLASKVTTINGSADLSITKSGPASAAAGFPIVYTITVINNGPSDAAAVTVADLTPAGTTFVSNSGACTTAFPCALGTVIAGQSKTITSTFTTPPSFTGTSIANSATVSSTTSDPSAGNNSATATTPFGPPNADLAVVKSGPASATPGSTISYTLTIVNNGPATASAVVVTDPTASGLSFVSNSGGCTGAFPCALGTLASGQSVTITSTYTVTAASGPVTNSAFVSGTSPDSNPNNDSSSVTTQIGTNVCGQQPPALIAPINGATVSSPVTFSWTAVPGASSYKVFASVGGASTQEIGNTTTTSLTVPVGGGTVTWSVQALGIPNCNQLQSANGTFNVCIAGTAPVLSVVGTSSAGQSYTVQWTDVGVSNYELEESSTDTIQTFPVTGTSKAFTKSATTPTAFFYRVRALSACGQGPGPYSASQRVVIVPVPPITSQAPSATVDINNKHVVVQTVFIPGQGSAIPFSATTDEPWLTVTPNSGILPAAGLTLTVSADPADLPNGTFTATIIVTFPGSPSKTGALDTKPPVTVPVSISVVTPVSPATQSTPSANSLIIPSVGHLDGINSQWRSDVRITNTSIQKINYLLRFTPAGDATQVKQTQISIASNDTMALDDIVKNWYGVGALGDAANGVLEVRPLNTSGKGGPGAEDVNVSFVTVASSRTFNQSAGGTLGQFIPAIPFANFIGKVTGDARAGILSMQQISQSASYRTNLGIVEASGKPASVLISVFDASGKKLLDLPVDLKAGEQQQLNSFLAANNITLTDGRVEVKVTAGDGKIMAYASVVDNLTSDPLLVTGAPLLQTPAHSFVIPGVADLNTGGANWRSDLRIFNAGTDPQYVTMTLYPLTGSSASDTIARSFTVNPGEVSVLDNVLASRFGVTNIGGAMHVDTLSDANLVVTGRTYNQVDGGGTYGQFISAVTPADGVGKGGHTLNVLQVEDSTRYRTNLGIAEVSGKPATVEVSVFLPDAKVAPKVTIPLAANEYRQFRVLQQLGVGTAYNARISIKVIDGDGKITAYGSVIDMQTQDPTYVPAQ